MGQTAAARQARAAARIERLTGLGYVLCTQPERLAGSKGAVVWSVMLHWAQVRGTSVQDRHGVYSGYEGTPDRLTARAAAAPYLCASAGCRHIITAGTLHGSDYYAHYCPCCVALDRPKTQFRPMS